MKHERRIEKFLKRIDVIPDAERKRLRLEELLEVRDKTQKLTSADIPPTFGSIIMNRQIWKVAAVLVVTATVVGVIGILQNGNQAALAFGQTVAAMQGGYYYHVQTYYGSPTQRHDEFWAEFNENGKLMRVRQLDQWKRDDWPVEVLWENQVEHKYTPNYWGGILVIRKAEQHVDENILQEFDPETMIEDIYMGVENGDQTIKIIDLLDRDGNLIFEATGNHPYRYLIFVDPETKLVRRMDQYHRSDEGNKEYGRGIEVLEYNHSFNPQIFDPDVFQSSMPKGTIIIDQISGPVGMVEGDFRSKDIAYEVAYQALESWATDDYETAGLLFGGAPLEFFERRLSLKPVADIVVAEVNPYEWYGPTFKVKCSYMAEQEGEQAKINVTLWVKTNEGQPGRWFIDPANVMKE